MWDDVTSRSRSETIDRDDGGFVCFLLRSAILDMSGILLREKVGELETPRQGFFFFLFALSYPGKVNK